MQRPRALGRRVAQPPTPFRHFRTIPSKKHIKQNQSLSGLHVIVICFRLLRRIRAPFQAISSKIRQFQAGSGKIRPFSCIFRQNQTKSGKIGQNQAKSGRIGGSGRSLVRDPMLFQKKHKLLPFFGQSFSGRIPSKLKPKQTTIEL